MSYQVDTVTLLFVLVLTDQFAYCSELSVADLYSQTAAILVPGFMIDVLGPLEWKEEAIECLVGETLFTLDPVPEKLMTSLGSMTLDILVVIT